MSKDNLIARWNILKQPIINELTCYVCYYNSNINNYKKYTATDIYYAGELIRYQCPNCNVIFGDLRFLQLPLEEIGNDYKDLYSFYSEGNTSQYTLRILNSINLGKDKIYLDYACGKDTNTLSLLNLNNYNVYGYDEYVHNPHPKFIYNNISTTFDVVYSNNYIEHVIQPYENLLKLVNLLNDNGKLVIISPCWEYCVEFTHYHTFFFIGKSFQYLCKKLGLREIHSEKIVFPDGEKTIVKIFEKTI